MKVTKSRELPKYANVRMRKKTYKRIKQLAYEHEMPIIWFMDAMVSQYEQQLQRKEK